MVLIYEKLLTALQYVFGHLWWSTFACPYAIHIVFQRCSNYWLIYMVIYKGGQAHVIKHW